MEQFTKEELANILNMTKAVSIKGSDAEAIVLLRNKIKNMLIAMDKESPKAEE